jgi:hypothetical protein
MPTICGSWKKRVDAPSERRKDHDMNNKPAHTRREVQLDNQDRELLRSLSRVYGSEAQAIRVAIRRLAEETK